VITTVPLNTRIIRNGVPLQIRWGSFHVAAMVCAASWDSGKGIFEDNSEPPTQTERRLDTNEEVTGHFLSPKNCFEFVDYGRIAATPLNEGSYVLKKAYTFIDITDGEILYLVPGDKLVAYRD